jgi:hypothetical protein
MAGSSTSRAESGRVARFGGNTDGDGESLAPTVAKQNAASSSPGDVTSAVTR